MPRDPHLLTDLRINLRHAQLRPVYEVATEVERARGIRPPRRLLDFGLVGGRDNLAQAILMRLLTPRGELEALAHPEYGSRLHELIGRPNTTTQRDLLKLYVLESLALEPRIEEVVSVSVSEVAHQPARVDVRIEVLPKGAGETVSIGPLELDLSP